MIAAAQTASDGTIRLDANLYAGVAVILAMIGVYLARLVTIDRENKRLRRQQTFRETGPLTWIAVLIVCPLIWHFKVPIPWAALVGLGIGYSVQLILVLLGAAAAGAFQAALKTALAATPGSEPATQEEADAEQRLIDKLDKD